MALIVSQLNPTHIVPNYFLNSNLILPSFYTWVLQEYFCLQILCLKFFTNFWSFYVWNAPHLSDIPSSNMIIINYRHVQDNTVKSGEEYLWITKHRCALISPHLGTFFKNPSSSSSYKIPDFIRTQNRKYNYMVYTLVGENGRQLSPAFNVALGAGDSSLSILAKVWSEKPWFESESG